MIRWKQRNHIFAYEPKINVPKRFDAGTWAAYVIRVFRQKSAPPVHFNVIFSIADIKQNY